MNGQQIQRVRVWSAGLRLAHWLIALSVLALLATGYLVAWSPSVASTASDYHDLASIGLTLGLVLRLWLAFSGDQTARWKALLPGGSERAAIAAMLRFYLSLGKTPLPRWYAHNPLWMPLYAGILLVLLLETASGLLMEAYPVLWGFYLPSVHAFWAPVILVFTGLHILAVALHDARGTASDVSAMINGHRVFVVDESGAPPAPGVQSIPLDQIGKSPGS